MCVHTHLHAILTACNSRQLARACQHPGQLREPPRACCRRLYPHCFATSALYCVKPLFGMSLPAAIHTTQDPAYLWSQPKSGVKSSQGAHQKVPAIGARYLASQDLGSFSLTAHPCPLASFPVFKSHCPTYTTPEHPYFSLHLLLLAQVTAELLGLLILQATEVTFLGHMCPS